MPPGAMACSRVRTTESEPGSQPAAGNLALLSHVEDGVEVTHLEALVFGLDAAFHHAFAESTHGRHGVVENLVAEVAGTAVKGCHFGQRGCVS